MKFSPSLEAIYSRAQISFSDKIVRAHAAGFSTFEFWSWWDKDLDEVERVIAQYNLTIGSFCTKFISLTDPAFRTEYIAGLEDSIAVAERLNCRYLISQVGNDCPGVSRAVQKQSVIDTLKRCAPLLEKSNITLILEPLNTKVDHPGYFLVSSEDGFDIVESIGCPRVKLVYDIYHQQVSEGDLIRTITSNLHHIAYFHVADHPGRHELGTGEINYPNIFRALVDAGYSGYSGYVGLEYFPTGDADASLRAMHELCLQFESPGSGLCPCTVHHSRQVVRNLSGACSRGSGRA